MPKFIFLPGTRSGSTTLICRHAKYRTSLGIPWSFYEVSYLFLHGSSPTREEHFTACPTVLFQNYDIVSLSKKTILTLYIRNTNTLHPGRLIASESSKPSNFELWTTGFLVLLKSRCFICLFIYALHIKTYLLSTYHSQFYRINELIEKSWTTQEFPVTGHRQWPGILLLMALFIDL